MEKLEEEEEWKFRQREVVEQQYEKTVTDKALSIEETIKRRNRQDQDQEKGARKNATQEKKRDQDNREWTRVM